MTLTMFTLNAFYGLALAMNMFIIASGLNLIFGVLRVINFAHGVFYMFGAYITFTVAKSWGAPFFIGVLAAAAGLAIIALLIERLLLKRLYGKEHLMQLLFTFAIVLLMSDGLDTGDASLLEEQMEKIEQRAGKVIWLNPLLGNEDYRPLARGMSAALPHVDIFASAHNLASLQELGKHLAL